MPLDQQSNDQHMVDMLGIVLTGDDSGAPVDNSIIAARLGWNLEAVASCLHEAKERSLVWGQRSGDKPAPWFKELEITVQGRRLLRSHSANA
ncbi:MAG TPA: hypothetical protein VNB52_00505 [Ilumatobacteraceae bacterium]|nr:hypothetical protein [Ilumatobacteraceae bacterium]